ncbi:hypothetical protein JTE90_014837 [Oedothorax gibbosus]|uniref:Uncharacterized protein n=1 Tax=Oedothorax gibbosus TaxID=931172 RepID=A0AAV6TE23_9ARAC|nr:hypothetical protein JTE90_014837 [Oedothorax gibbosus]
MKVQAGGVGRIGDPRSSRAGRTETRRVHLGKVAGVERTLWGNKEVLNYARTGNEAEKFGWRSVAFDVKIESSKFWV